jgi:hypothetical protein
MFITLNLGWQQLADVEANLNHTFNPQHNMEPTQDTQESCHYEGSYSAGQRTTQQSTLDTVKTLSPTGPPSIAPGLTRMGKLGMMKAVLHREMIQLVHIAQEVNHQWLVKNLSKTGHHIKL